MVNSVDACNYKQFQELSGHVLSRLSHADYLQTTVPISPWACVAGWNILNCFRDFMHNAYLGTVRDLLGSCVKLMVVSGVLLGETLLQKLRLLSEEMWQASRANGVHMARRYFTAANCGLDQPQFAELGSVFKAAQVKAMLWFFASKMTAHAADVPEGRYVAACVWALLRAVQIFDGSSLILHEHDAREASRMILLHLRTWQVLAARLEHLRVFYIRPKHHYMHHVAEDLLRTRLNPRSYQCFDDEAFLSRVKSISTKCHALTMTQRCLERYLLHLSFRVERV